MYKRQIYLRENEMREVLHGDRVVVELHGRDKRRRMQGRIVEVSERANSAVVGRLFLEAGNAFVVPEDQRIGQDIYVESTAQHGASPGQVVVAKITRPPTKHFQPSGEIVEVLGDYLAPGMEIEIAKRKHQIPDEWPSEVLEQLKPIPDEVRPSETRARIDLRKLPLVTIDGEDARDFDDAVYCQRHADGFRLVVAIADVSHYVEVGSALDREAWTRGTSVYFPSAVVPMLPEKLSNGLCSLNPHVDRLCMVCDVQISNMGEILEYDFYPAVMHSHARLTYTEVAAFIEGRDEVLISESISKEISNLNELSKCLREYRQGLGMLEFDLSEPIIEFDDNRKISRIGARVRNDAHKLIEECMLVANICASLALDESALVGMFRIHEQPDEDKVEDLRNYLRQFKILLAKNAPPSPQAFMQAISSLEDKRASKVVQSAMLRSLKQARYSTENQGHFALNFDSYTHLSLIHI